MTNDSLIEKIKERAWEANNYNGEFLAVYLDDVEEIIRQHAAAPDVASEIRYNELDVALAHSAAQCLEPIADRDWDGKWRIKKALAFLSQVGDTEPVSKVIREQKACPAGCDDGVDWSSGKAEVCDECEGAGTFYVTQQPDELLEAVADAIQPFMDEYMIKQGQLLEAARAVISVLPKRGDEQPEIEGDCQEGCQKHQTCRQQYQQPVDMPANINTVVKIRVEKATRLNTVHVMDLSNNAINMEIEDNIYLEPGNYGFRFCVVNYPKVSLPGRESGERDAYHAMHVNFLRHGNSEEGRAMFEKYLRYRAAGHSHERADELCTKPYNEGNGIEDVKP